MFKSKKRALTPERRRAAAWRLFGYGSVTLWFLATSAAAWLRPDFNRTELPDWRPVLALAEAARERGDRHQARHLNRQGETLASWKSEWEGLVAAACAFKKLDGVPVPHSKSNTLLIRAAIVAEQKQSRQGMTTVARAFTLMGRHRTASLFLARIGAEWPLEQNDPLEFPLRACEVPTTR